jgi:two-component system sensor histidine kinase UhpB
MSTRAVTLLHIEDDAFQQRLLAHHLEAMPEFRFEIRHAETEDAAIRALDEGRVEFVILDYNLRQGNGLSCVQEIRNRDAVVPIIAISGVATPDIAADLLEAGADDYIEKRELTSAVLAKRLRETLMRADACRRRACVPRP